MTPINPLSVVGGSHVTLHDVTNLYVDADVDVCLTSQ